ncbi:hypothetical protein FBQ99_16625 [Chloroflexi bacterium CFX2]|nr:hypothetical protein [Chloroflexi bacterium CFX2]
MLYPDAWIEREPGTVTAHLNVTYAVFEMDGVEYKLVPFELPDPSNPAYPSENIKVLGFQLANEIKNGVIGKTYPRGAFDRFSNYWATEVKVPPISTDFRYPLTNVEIPLARMTWEKLGAEKMAEIFQRVQNGDVAALKELRGYPVMLTNQFSDNYTK